MNAAASQSTTSIADIIRSISAFSLPEMGTPMPGGKLVGFMPAIDGNAPYLLILPTDPAANTEEEFEWGPYGEEVEGLSDWDGLANTRILAARGDAHAAAKRCAELVIDGFNDYYLISAREASAIRAFAPHLMPKGWHWTSSQYSASLAFIQDFSSGFQIDDGKHYAWRVCAVRRIPLIN